MFILLIVNMHFWNLCPPNILLFKVNNKNTRKRCKICQGLFLSKVAGQCSKSTIKTPEQYQSDVALFFIVNFEHNSFTPFSKVFLVNLEHAGRKPLGKRCDKSIGKNNILGIFDQPLEKVAGRCSLKQCSDEFR